MSIKPQNILKFGAEQIMTPCGFLPFALNNNSLRSLSCSVMVAIVAACKLTTETEVMFEVMREGVRRKREGINQSEIGVCS